ncbi:MAG: DegT/DnrJ/EryC1/StrS family aminotransferase [Deltaproteobacteria bacterium]|nr:DegT/DnrJ/EryC1/StrS family aminotransferase [Deltaproteobacteria bacterium]
MSKPESKPDFIVFGAPLIGEEEIEEVVATLRSGWIGTGPKVKRFEGEFARYKGVEDAVAVASCTAALHLSLLDAGIGPGDEVITTPLTFCATVNAIHHTGATPVLVDVDPVTQNIDPARVAEALTPKTKAILPVHFAGRPCEMDALTTLAEDAGLLLIEDCAHAIETEYHGRKAGTFGSYGCFSFYATKNLSTAEGGMILAADPERMARLRQLALHGMSKDAWKRFGGEGFRHYQVVEFGWKANMTDLQASMGVHQLARLEECYLRRQEVWSRYDQGLAGLPLGTPAPPDEDTRHGLHLYTIRVDEEACGLSRDALLDALTARGVGTGVHYLSVAEHPVYQERLGWKAEEWPEALRIGRQTLSLPLSAKLTDSEVEHVLWAVKDALAGA